MKILVTTTTINTFHFSLVGEELVSNKVEYVSLAFIVLRRTRNEFMTLHVIGGDGICVCVVSCLDIFS